MGQLIKFPPAARTDAILEAVRKQSPAVITVPVINRWVTLKSAFVAADPDAGLISLARPLPDDGQPQPSLKPGQSISISFRRGHRKCICVTAVVRGTGTEQEGRLQIQWPDEILAVQRRAYFRAPVPEDMEVPVRLWRGGRTKRRLAAIGKWPSVTGHLADISAGGMRLDVPASEDPQLQVGEPVAVEFAPLPQVGQLCLDANFRHCLPQPNGWVGLGLQFVGLEGSPAGRQILLVLGQVSAEYLRRKHGAPPDRHRPGRKAWRPPTSADNTVYEPAGPAG